MSAFVIGQLVTVEEAALKVLEGGPWRTHQLATRIARTTSQMLTVMRRLEKRGLVRRNARYSAVNDISWELVA